MVGAYTPLLRRRREGKTDYRARKALLLSRRPFATVRVSGKNVVIQIAQAEAAGDRVLASAHSRELLGHGWRGSRKNVPAAYLTGLVAGLKARRAGVAQLLLYTGPRPFAPTGRIAAVVKGLQEAGLSIPADPTVLPKAERLHGEHIAQYGRKRIEGEKAPIRRRPSQTSKAVLPGGEYPKLVEQVKIAIQKELGGRVE